MQTLVIFDAELFVLTHLSCWPAGCKGPGGRYISILHSSLCCSSRGAQVYFSGSSPLFLNNLHYLNTNLPPPILAHSLSLHAAKQKSCAGAETSFGSCGEEFWSARCPLLVWQVGEQAELEKGEGTECEKADEEEETPCTRRHWGIE